jgi:hypothetical protein
VEALNNKSQKITIFVKSFRNSCEKALFLFSSNIASEKCFIQAYYQDQLKMKKTAAEHYRLIH